MDVQEHAAPAPRPVAVQKPNRLADKSTNHNGRSPANGDSAPSRKSSAPPVPVVKSNRHHDERAGRADHDESDFDPNATVVLNRAVKLHKPARLASQSSDYSSLSDDYWEKDTREEFQRDDYWKKRGLILRNAICSRLTFL